MIENSTSCSRFGVSHTRPICKSDRLIKSGKTTNNKQRYCCKDCRKRFILSYNYNAYRSNTNQQIVLFTKEGLGIRSTSRVLKILVTTLLKRIISIAKNIEQPPVVKGKTYEVDEMRTFIGKRACCAG
jgi:insertion element IS1 protein InsB